MKNIHGHDLLSLLAQQDKGLTLNEIKELSVKTFGNDVVYETCSASNMSTDDLINFLVNRQKIVEISSGYVLNQGNVCEH